MIFSSLIFLYYFLPLVLLGYYVIPVKAWRNVVLLTASLAFYAFGEMQNLWVLLLSIALNYVFARLIENRRGTPAARRLVWAGVAANLGLLAYFKYVHFITTNLNAALGMAGITPALPEPSPVLPLGISFFAFQGWTYLVDVYRGHVAAQRNPLYFAMYKAFFPQLIAGPIVRYADVAGQIYERRVTWSLFASGVERFITGLGKKVLIANTLAVPADAIFNIPAHELTAAQAWLGAVCYAFQIYFDFSGYSDMAIGMGRIFGFTFLENFNYPYAATSVTDFWRRWHISLSTVFRDYVYIPLGGNRLGRARTYFNLSLVFFLCGLWHGASWTFVAWGIYHGVFLSLERMLHGRIPLPRWLGWPYAMLAVLVGWVFFRAETLGQAFSFLGAMGSGSANGLQSIQPHLSGAVELALIAAALGSVPLVPWLAAHEQKIALRAWPMCGALARLSFLAMVMACSSARLCAGTYNPFIYFRF